MLKPTPEYSAGVKGQGRLSVLKEALLIDSGEKASQLKSNGLLLQGAVLGSAPGVSVVGDDTNIDLVLAAKGTGAIEIQAPEVTAEVAANCKSGAAKSIFSLVKSATNLANNTASDFDVACTVTVPNANLVGSIGLLLHASLGDQDSTEVSYWTIAISRIAGAAAKATVSSKSSNANTTGATANCSATITVTAMSGGNGATQTFKIQITVARSAGSSTNHDALAFIDLLNMKGSGITIS